MDLALGDVSSHIEGVMRHSKLRAPPEARIGTATCHIPHLPRPKIGLFRRAVVAAVEGRSREPALVVVGSPYWSCVVGSADDA